MMYAKVIVDVPSNNTDDTFTYLVPRDLVDCVYLGTRVYVEFGFQKVMGYVLELGEDREYSGSIKEIIEVIDFEEGLTNEQLEIAKNISKDTKSFLTSSLALMYPAFMRSKVRKFINVKNYKGLDAELAILFGNKQKILINNEILSKFPKIKKEIEKGNLEITSDLFRYGSRKLERFYRLANFNYQNLSERRLEVLDFVKGRGEATQDEIIDNTKGSDYIINRLVKDNYLEFEERVKLEESKEDFHSKVIKYNFDQQQLYDKYQKLHGKPFLLYTNDEAFKLDFFLNIAIDTVKSGHQV
ncbi:MAG: hypothetical protein PHX62_01855, partial [Bacilli bacterium]|nr:hypothetical protein [Bacilli bacterium]